MFREAYVFLKSPQIVFMMSGRGVLHHFRTAQSTNFGTVIPPRLYSKIVLVFSTQLMPSCKQRMGGIESSSRGPPRLMK